MIRDLQFFVRLCRDGSIRKAAEALFISPQGLSKAMKNLEAELGVQLFTRSNEGVVPTEAGKIVAKRARKVLDEYDNLKLALRDHQRAAPNAVKVTVASGVINALQPDFLHEFQNRYPEVELLVGEYPDIPGEEAVADGEADVGFAIGPVDRRKFKSFLVREDELYVLVNKSNSLAAERRLGFGDLTREKWVVPNDKYKSYHAIVGKCAELGVKPRISMVASEINMVYKFCQLNNGIGIAGLAGLRESGYEDVECIPLAPESRCPWDIHLITPKRAAPAPAVRAFVEHVRSWFATGE